MNKKQLVLIPGLLSDHTLWEYQVKYLSSIANIHIPKFNHLNQTTQYIQAILNQAPEQFALAGHSMGGWLAMEIAIQYPEKVSELCLINTTGSPDSEDKKESRLKLMALYQADPSALLQKILNAFVYNRDVDDAVLSMFKTNLPQFLSQEEALLNRRDNEPNLKTIKAPTLIIHSSKDTNFPIEHAENLLKSIPKAKLAVVEESGHMSPMEAGAAVTSLMRYWLTYF